MADDALVDALNRSTEAAQKLCEISEKKNADPLDKEQTKRAMDDVTEIDAKRDKLLQKEVSDQLALKMQEMKDANVEKGESGLTAEEQKYDDAYDSWFRKDEQGITAEQRQTLDQKSTSLLETTDADRAGRLIAPQLWRTILKQLVESSPLRSVISIRTTSGNSMRFVTLSAKPSPTWVAEGGTATKGVPSYSEKTITLGKEVLIVPITNEMLADSAFNITAEIRDVVNEQFSDYLNRAYWSGTGTNEPVGMQSNITTGITTASATTISADELLSLQGSLKRGYNAVWMMNRATMTFLRMSLKDGNGNYLLQPLNTSQQNTLLGNRVIDNPHMDTVAAGKKVIVYGDFNRAYTALDKRSGLTTLRDPYTRKAQDIVEFSFTLRAGGDMIMPEALTSLVMKATT